MAGTIRKRGNKYLMEYMHKGKRYSKTIDFNNEHLTERQLEKELSKILSKFIFEIEDKMTPASNISFLNFSQNWLDSHSNLISHRTRDFYKQMLNKNISPYFLSCKIKDIDFYKIQSFFNYLNDSYSKKTMLHYKNLLNIMFKDALKLDLIKSNPIQFLSLPNGTNNKKENGFYTEDEAKNLLECLKDEDLKHRLFIELGLKCGMRKGEILALSWEDIDLSLMYLHVNKAKTYSTEFGEEVKAPKTKTSDRYINIPNSTITLLKEYKKESKQENLFDEKYNSFTRWFNRFIVRNNLKHITIHGLRHTHATLLISKNIDIQTVSARLGHSQVSTTMNIYSHALKEKDKIATDVLNNIF